jgi:hypothetical protein
VAGPLSLPAVGALAAVALLAGACGGSQPSSGGAVADGGGSTADTGAAWDAGAGGDAAVASDDGGATQEAGPVPADGSIVVGDASVSASRFVTGVVTFAPTDCAGFGAASMPGIVLGPPEGGGTTHGSTDVVSLGSGGSIVVSFAPNAIVDGPGPDFIVFENPFWIGGSASDVYAEPGEVSVSDDGTTWQTFPCTPTIDPQAADGTGTAPPYGACAGWHVVYSNSQNGISPLDPAVAGGDAFDLHDLGVTHARYVRIVDKTSESCPAAGASKPTTNGFDLDAVAIVHAETP